MPACSQTDRLSAKRPEKTSEVPRTARLIAPMPAPRASPARERPAIVGGNRHRDVAPAEPNRGHDLRERLQRILSAHVEDSEVIAGGCTQTRADDCRPIRPVGRHEGRGPLGEFASELSGLGDGLGAGVVAGNDQLDGIKKPVRLEKLSIFRQACGGERSPRQQRKDQADSPDPNRRCSVRTRRHSKGFSLGSRVSPYYNSPSRQRARGKGAGRDDFCVATPLLRWCAMSHNSRNILVQSRQSGKPGCRTVGGTGYLVTLTKIEPCDQTPSACSRAPSIQPPPSTRSPSYTVTTCPGAIADCGDVEDDLRPVAVEREDRGRHRPMLGANLCQARHRSFRPRALPVEPLRGQTGLLECGLGA